MRIVPPAPNIEPYEDGFEGFDRLQRSLQGKQLSELVDKIDDPLVIAVDGPWGSGKSFFLQCWVGAHRKENKGSAETVYFDAFENDFLDDPLISLTSAIARKLKKEPQKKEIWEKAKKAAAVLWRPAARVTLAAVTAGASEAVGSVAGAAMGASHSELDRQVENLWKREECQRAAMGEFRDALTALTHPDGKSREPRKLVVTIDELDRCRPDYALSVLEVIKHFFNVPHVHFVLGVNLDEMANSVRARYGQSTNAELYLQKFISVTLNLSSEITDQNQNKPIGKKYFEQKAKEMGLPEKMINGIGLYLDRPQISNKLSLRAAEKILTQMALVPQGADFFEKKLQGYCIALAGLIVMKALFPVKYKAIKEKTLTTKDIQSLFDISESSDIREDYPAALINQVWTKFLDPEKADQSDYYRDLFGLYGLGYPADKLNRLIQDRLETIKIGAAMNG